MSNGNCLRTSVGRSAGAPVAFGFFFALLDWALLLRIGGRKHRAGLLRRALLRQHARQRVQRFFQLLAFRFAQRDLASVIDDLIQFFQIHVHTFAFHAPRTSRNLR
jgi:hypothetical protein